MDENNAELHSEENPPPCHQTLYLGRKPDDTDLISMQEQDPAIKTMQQLVLNLPSATGTLTPDNEPGTTSSPPETKAFQA